MASLTPDLTGPDVSLFAEFDARELAAIAAGTAQAAQENVRARAMRRSGRVSMRRAKSEEVLADVLPLSIEDGDSLHVISHGDIDCLSYLRHLLRAHRFDHLLLSTWCMARPDVEEIHGWLRDGRLGVVDWYVGEIFPGSFVVESSANLNTNPRIEQTTITRSEDLYFFYQDFFGAMRSFVRG